MENGAFDVIIKKATKLTYNVIASASGVSKVKNSKNTKKENVVAANKAMNLKKQTLSVGHAIGSSYLWRKSWRYSSKKAYWYSPRCLIPHPSWENTRSNSINSTML